MTHSHSSAVAPSESDIAWNELWTKRCAVLHTAYVTYRYHRRRQRFFDLTDKLTKSATVLLGATLMGDLLKQHVPLAASAIAGLGLLSLVFGYGDRKQAHKELAEQAIGLVGRIEEAAVITLSEEVVGGWAAEQARINAKEPPSLKTLVVICEHEQAAASGHADHIPRPPWYRRLVADFKS